MQRDIEYWQDEASITVEPKTVKGRTTMVDEFPLYSKAKQYRAYLAANGMMRWEFPLNSSAIKHFLESGFCDAAQVAA